jgi:hypothetical protein
MTLCTAPRLSMLLALWLAAATVSAGESGAVARIVILTDAVEGPVIGALRQRL